MPKVRVERALARYLRRIRSQVGLQKAILFGSYARGNYSHGSDIDLAIIADGLPQDHAKRYALLKDTVGGLELQPFAYTVKEWENMTKTKSSFTQEILRHGKTLYSRGPRDNEETRA